MNPFCPHCGKDISAPVDPKDTPWEFISKMSRAATLAGIELDKALTFLSLLHAQPEADRIVNAPTKGTH